MNTAILLLIWRRPEHTKEIIKSIRKISPKRIYVSSDGPIENDIENKKLVELTRDIVSREINWECTIKTNYLKVNKGCKIAVSDGITWFFSYEEEGIILEDDCLPNKDFYYFCESILEKYRSDHRIWAVCGNGYQNNKIVNKSSYFFSRYVDVWGWATWKRCWDRYDRDIVTWKDNKSLLKLKDLFRNNREFKYWKIIFDDLCFNNKPDTWDYQWQYLCFMNSGMICMPYTNLVENIGFDKDATHTKNFPITLDDNINKIGKMIFPLKHPNEFVRSKNCDNYLQNIFYSGYPLLSVSGIKLRIKKSIFKLKKLFFN